LFEIDTGFELGQEGPVQISGTTWHPLFTEQSPLGQVWSPRVEIRPGKVYMFQGHNIPEDRKIFVNMVTPLVVGRSRRKDGSLAEQVSDAYWSRVTLGGAETWTMDRDHGLLLISLPGVYRFELEDEDMLPKDELGKALRLEYQYWDAQPLPFFPVMR
jgi:hypothetical protein